MSKMTKKQKNILKWAFVMLLVCVVVYAFRDSAGPIYREIKETSPKILVMILLASMAYEFVESIISYILVSQYSNSKLTFLDANFMTYFISFYRVTTLGSGVIVAAFLYLRTCGLKSSEGFGMYVVQYAIHKISIAVIGVVAICLDFAYVMGVCGEYKNYLLLGVAATVVITVVLVLFAGSTKFHKGLYFVLDKMNFHGKFTRAVDKLKTQCQVMEDGAKVVLKKPGVIVGALVLNVVKSALWFAIPYIILRGEPGIYLFRTIGITAICIMLAGVIPIPGGIASSEFVLIAIFSGIVGGTDAAAMSLLYRFATFVFPFLLGTIVAIFFREIRRRKQRLYPEMFVEMSREKDELDMELGFDTEE